MAEWKISPPRFKTLRRLCIRTRLIRTASQKQTQRIICVFLVLLTSPVVAVIASVCVCVSIYHGRFPFNPKYRLFRLVHQMERTISVSVRPEYSGPALKATSTGLVISVGRTEISLSIAEIVFSSTTLLYSACFQEQLVVSNGK